MRIEALCEMLDSTSLGLTVEKMQAMAAAFVEYHFFRFLVCLLPGLSYPVPEPLLGRLLRRIARR